jgi:hypothetical protein
MLFKINIKQDEVILLRRYLWPFLTFTVKLRKDFFCFVVGQQINKIGIVYKIERNVKLL